MKRFAIAVLALIVVGFMAMPATAQVNTLNPNRLGDLYISAAQDSHVDYLQLIPISSPFNFYLVIDIDFGDIDQASQNLTNGVQAWEAQAALPPTLFILGATLAPATSINVGTQTGNTYDFLVGTGSLVSAGGPQVLVSFQALATSAFSGTATLAPVAAPSVPGEAVWVEFSPLNGCDINGLDEACQFRFANLGNLRLSTGIPDDVDSFGGLKSRF